MDGLSACTVPAVHVASTIVVQAIRRISFVSTRDESGQAMHFHLYRLEDYAKNGQLRKNRGVSTPPAMFQARYRQDPVFSGRSRFPCGDNSARSLHTMDKQVSGHQEAVNFPRPCDKRDEPFPLRYIPVSIPHGPESVFHWKAA